MARNPIVLGGGHGFAAAAVISLLLAASKSYKPRPPTAEQIAAQGKRTEQQRWNDEVEHRKADKKAAKGGGKND